MRILQTPSSKYEDLYDQERFNFTWKLFLSLALVLSFLTILHGIKDDNNFFVTLAALGIVALCIFITYVSKSYVYAAVIGIILGSCVNQLDLFLIVSSQKFVTTLWIVSIAISAFYLLGNKFGFVTLFLNLIGVVSALYIVPKVIQIERIANQDEYGVILISINLLVITFYISYLMIQILKTSRSAESRSRIAKEELQKQYDIVQAQNEEKTVMLKEIHHRVKNNLQVITSLLRLQSREIKDQNTLVHFEDAINRVQAMALIHEKMYQSEELSRIDLEGYITDLVQELVRSYAVEKDIELDIECEINYIQPKSLVSFALMFNELISNSLQHGFKDQKTGKIEIRIKLPQNNQVITSYSDNGTWLSPQKEGSFGMELISDLCEQLDGTFERTSNEGTHYEFVFDYLNLEEYF
ncbi:MAG: two-component sensor histidine kinase [Arenicella sp.]|jgi:two-component sensor histidine kinase